MFLKKNSEIFHLEKKRGVQFWKDYFGNWVNIILQTLNSVGCLFCSFSLIVAFYKQYRMYILCPIAWLYQQMDVTLCIISGCYSKEVTTHLPGINIKQIQYLLKEESPTNNITPLNDSKRSKGNERNFMTLQINQLLPL